MDSPSVPFLVLAAAAASAVPFWRARVDNLFDEREARACFLVLGVLACWVAASSILAIRGVYLAPWALQYLPLLVGFLVPTVFVALCLWRVRTLRVACRKVIAGLPIRGLVGIQAWFSGTSWEA